MTQLTPATSRGAAVQYDGINGSAIAALFTSGFEIVSDDGEIFEFEYLDIPHSIGVGGWVLTAGGAHVSAALSNEDFTVSYMLLPTPTLVERSGNAAVPAKALGGSNDVTVTLNSAMQAVSWIPEVQLLGTPGIVGGHGYTGYTVVDADTVTVHITSVLGALAGATARVVAREVV